MGCSEGKPHALATREVPRDLQEYVAKAAACYDQDGAAIPCEHCGSPHSNWGGTYRGFCSAEHFRAYNSHHVKTIKDVEGNILDQWEELNADFAIQHAGLASAFLPSYGKMQSNVFHAMEGYAAQYRDLLKQMPEDDLSALARFEELWPCGTYDELKELSVQPERFATLRLTYAAGLRCLEPLYLFTLGLARLVGADCKAVGWSVKRPVRLWRKTVDSYPEEFGRNDFRHCSDVYRSSMCVDHLGQVEALLDALEGLGRDAYDREAALHRLGLGRSGAHFVVERIKNRFAGAALGGYMDLLVNLRINGYVTEVQVHLARFLRLKGEAGRAACKWFERYVRFEDEYWGDRAEDGSPHGRGTLYPVGGGRYDGDFFAGRKHGSGTTYYDNGDRYEGEFMDGKKHGHGIFFFVNGDRYKGGFVADKMHGSGTFFFANGDRYEGGYNGGKRHGLGTYYFSDGRTVDGEWWHNKHVDVVSL
mmetsp:Transcript_114198/g.323413  ORF Transcript_114198/g.323413 Transcript_114198/m.323413 type:complete len:476 (-) Transcript_114198:67-1494(-)